MKDMTNDINFNVTHKTSFWMAITLDVFIIVIGLACALIMLVEMRLSLVLLLFVLASMFFIFLLPKYKFIRATHEFVLIGRDVVEWNDITKMIFLDIVGSTCIIKYVRGNEHITVVTVMKLFDPYDSLIENILSVWNNAIHENVVVSHNMLGAHLVPPHTTKSSVG